MLLMAALHYSWKTGSLQAFENTFLFHKGESIRLVNDWLGDRSVMTITSCIKLVATLSIAEVGLDVYYPCIINTETKLLRAELCRQFPSR
jgi:hypothetical protein